MGTYWRYLAPVGHMQKGHVLEKVGPRWAHEEGDILENFCLHGAHAEGHILDKFGPRLSHAEWALAGEIWSPLGI